VEGAAAPPPSPPLDPDPVVVEAGGDDPSALMSFRGAPGQWDLDATARGRHLEWLERGWTWGFTWLDRSATQVAGFVTEVDPPDPRLAAFRSQWGPAAQRLLTALTLGFAAEGGLALTFRGPI
jgi:hypothetical protein